MLCIPRRSSDRVYQRGGYDGTSVPHARNTEEHMDYGWMSHALLWFVGALSTATAVCVVGAFFSLGRSYKD